MGRPKHSPNKATATRERTLEKQGLMPLAYMLSILRNETEPDEKRAWAAEKAAPYCHPRLSQIDANHSGSLDIRGWLTKLGEPD